MQQWRVHLLYLVVLKSDAMCRHVHSRFEFEFEARIMNVLCVVPNPDNYEFELNTCPNKTIFECAKTVGYFSALYSTTRYDFLKFDALISLKPYNSAQSIQKILKFLTAI